MIAEAQRWAADEARELGDNYIGPEHFLLGLLRHESVAADALHDCGVTYEDLRERMSRRNPWDTETARRAGLSPNPAAYALIGRMEGFAAAAGAEAVAPEHVLLAALWDRDRMFADGPSRAEVKRALGVLGVPVPPQDPPPGDTRDRGEPVFIPVERLDDVLREMRRQLIPKDGTIAFNYYPPDRTKAFVVSDAGFDLQRLVDEVLAH